MAPAPIKLLRRLRLRIPAYEASVPYRLTKKWTSQIRSRPIDAITATDWFFTEIVISAAWLAAIEWNGDIIRVFQWYLHAPLNSSEGPPVIVVTRANDPGRHLEGLRGATRSRPYTWFMSEDEHIWNSTLYFDLSKVIQGHWPWLTPYLPTVAKFAFYGAFWCHETERASFFSHRHVYKAYWRFAMLISANFPKAIFPLRVTLLPSRMIEATIIRSRYRKDTVFCSELNGNILVKVSICYG